MWIDAETSPEFLSGPGRGGGGGNVGDIIIIIILEDVYLVNRRMVSNITIEYK